MRKINFSTVSLIMRLFGAILSGFLISEIAPTASFVTGEGCKCGFILIFYIVTCIIAIAINAYNNVKPSARNILISIIIGYALALVFLHYGHPLSAGSLFILNSFAALIETRL